MRQVDRCGAIEGFLQIDKPGLASRVDQEVSRMGVGTDEAQCEIRFAPAGKVAGPVEVFPDCGQGFRIEPGTFQGCSLFFDDEEG